MSDLFISKDYVLPRFGNKSNKTTKGGLTYFQTDNTDQNFSNNKNDLIFYDVSQKNPLNNTSSTQNTTGNTIENTVFSVNSKIGDVDPNDDKNENDYNHLENAINLAMCGAWENDEQGNSKSLCVQPWGNKDKPNLVNYARTPKKYRTTENLSTVINSLDKFADTTTTDSNGDLISNPNNLTNSISTGGNIDKQRYYNGMFYLINKYLLAKARFYNSDNSLNSSKPGIYQFTDLFLKSGNTTKFFLLIVVLLSIYLFLKGLSAITNVKSSKKLETKGIIGFVVVWILIIIATVIAKFGVVKNYYTLFNGNNLKINEPCKTNIGDKLSNIKWWVSIFSIFAIVFYLYMTNWLWNNFSKNNSNNPKNFIINFILIIVFSIVIAFISSPTFFNNPNNDDNLFKMSYKIDGINDLPYQNTYTQNNINLSFWIAIFAIIIIVSLSKAISTLFGQKNKKDTFSIFAQPWLQLRGLFVIAFNILLVYYIPYYPIIYPIICMLQRLIIGSFVLPHILNNIPGLGKFNKMDKAQQLVLFNAFVGWDLPGWSFLKIIDVLEKLLGGGGGDIMGLLKGDGSSSGNTANINVFTEFDNSSLLSGLTSFAYVLIPWMYYNKNCKYGKWVTIIFMIGGLLGAIFLSTWFTNLINNKNIFDSPWKHIGSKWSSSIYLIIYFFIICLLIAKNFNYNLIDKIPLFKKDCDKNNSNTSTSTSSSNSSSTSSSTSK